MKINRLTKYLYKILYLTPRDFYNKRYFTVDPVEKYKRLIEDGEKIIIVFEPTKEEKIKYLGNLFKKEPIKFLLIAVGKILIFLIFLIVSLSIFAIQDYNLYAQ